jgi:hypothetical protein
MIDDPLEDLAIPETSAAKVEAPAKRRGRLPGSPRTPRSGRKKGVPNKINGSIHDMMKALGCDPRMVLARICMNSKNPPELRRKAASDLMNYMYPRLASTEQHVTGETQTIVQVITGIARSPIDPPLSDADAERWRHVVDNGAPEPHLLSPPADTCDAGSHTVPEEQRPDVAERLAAGRPWSLSSSPAETGPSEPSSISPARFDSKSDEVIDRERSADAQIRELNARASRFVA